MGIINLSEKRWPVRYLVVVSNPEERDLCENSPSFLPFRGFRWIVSRSLVENNSGGA